jgi:hypothetical protein
MVEGRSIHEGAEKALNALHLLRAIWSLAATMGRWAMRFGGPARRPIGIIHTGPFHTLHLPDGRAADENYYWYDPDYTGDQELFNGSGRWPQIDKYRRWAMRRFRRLPYRRDLEEVLLRYIDALDQSNPNVSFLQMWGILEKITNTVGAQYDETIKRATRVYGKADRLLMKDLLGTLRLRRNQYVHSGKNNQESTDVSFLVKSFVDPHLGRLIQNQLSFQSLQEYGEHLALPTDIKTLKRMRKWSAQALRQEREEDSEELSSPAS